VVLRTAQERGGFEGRGGGRATERDNMKEKKGRK